MQRFALHMLLHIDQVRSGQVRSECLTCTFRASCCTCRAGSGLRLVPLSGTGCSCVPVLHYLATSPSLKTKRPAAYCCSARLSRAQELHIDRNVRAFDHLLSRGQDQLVSAVVWNRELFNSLILALEDKPSLPCRTKATARR